MSKFTITPWRHQADLLQVRQQLYSLDTDEPNQCRHAVDRVMAWKLRGNLPHAVESTALLVDAVLHHHHHDTGANSSFSIRAVYSAAFTRFVTGFCDIGRHKERSLEPSSMLDIAKQIDMPLHFVALRHEATHEEMPGIQRLVKATDEALQWLWKVYWSRLEEVESVDTTTAALSELRDQTRQLLRSFRNARLEALRSNVNEATGPSRETAEAVTSSMQLMGGNALRTEAFATVLVQDGFLWPYKREREAALDGAFLIWDPLLQNISLSQKRFLQILLHAMLNAFVDPTKKPNWRDAEYEALCFWLGHIVDLQSWTSIEMSTKQALRREMIQWCCLNPGTWSYHLGTILIDSGDSEFLSDWKDILEASRLDQGLTDPPLQDADSEKARGMQGMIVEGDAAPDADGHVLPGSSSDDGMALGGWARAVRAFDKPIGVV